MVDRIKQIMEYEQMSPTTFADTIDINRSSLTHIFSGRNQPSLDIAKKILTTFPEISTEWLIMGVGNMMNSDSARTQPTKEEESSISVSNVDNMQQTDLFSAIEMAEFNTPMPVNQPKETVTAKSRAEDLRPVVKEEPKTKAQTFQENVPVVEPEEAPVSRTRAKNQESHISARESKRERISNSQGDKKISKIIFFYDDRSFEIYTPN